MTTTTQKVPCSTTATTRWLVLVDGKEVGLIEKTRSTKTTLNPFKAFKGIGFDCTFVGSVYDKTEATKWGLVNADGDTVFGGFEGAIAQVVS